MFPSENSSKLDKSLMDAYLEIHEGVRKGHAAGDTDIAKQASQLASDVKYKAKGKVKPGANKEEIKKVYMALLSASPAPAPVKVLAKRKLLGEETVVESGYFPDKKSQKEDEAKYNLSKDELPGRHKPVKRNPDGSLKNEELEQIDEIAPAIATGAAAGIAAGGAYLINKMRQRKKASDSGQGQGGLIDRLNQRRKALEQ